jgi:hypothetical protein
MSNPTEKDNGQSLSDLRIEIVVNPVTKHIAITENVHDFLLFNYVMGQALQTYAQKQMEDKRKLIQEARSRRLTVL